MTEPAEARLAEELGTLRQTTDHLAEARRLLADAEEALANARQAVHHQMRATGLAFLAADRPYPIDLLRELYWDNPEVHAEEIAHAFGMRAANEVSRTVGPDTRTLPCGNECGNAVIRSIRSRTELTSRSLTGSRDPRLCADCREYARLVEAERAARHREDARRMRAAQAAERARLEEAIANGLKPSQVYASYPGFGDPNNAWSISSLQDVTDLVTPGEHVDDWTSPTRG